MINEFLNAMFGPPRSSRPPDEMSTRFSKIDSALMRFAEHQDRDRREAQRLVEREAERRLGLSGRLAHLEGRVAVLEGKKPPKTLYCSFCGKSEHEVDKLISAPLDTSFICDECVDMCVALCTPGVSNKSNRSEP